MEKEKKKNHKDGIARFGVTLPQEKLAIIDAAVKEQYITRSKWIFDAVVEKIERDKLKRINDLVNK